VLDYLELNYWRNMMMRMELLITLN
jgi:hypothetical protein